MCDNCGGRLVGVMNDGHSYSKCVECGRVYE
jgi:hypothetical protein